MITNETRANLIGRKWMHLDVPCEGDGHAGCGLVPWDPEHDANAVADLRAFVRARGKEKLFTVAIDRQLTADTRGASRFELLDATPAQQTAAFDAVFRDDLERINET